MAHAATKLPLLALLCLTLPACQLFFGDDDDDALPDIDAGAPPDAAAPPDARPPADASVCGELIGSFTPQPSPHVTPTTAVTYPTNPPSSGPHYAQWVRWNATYAEPGVKRENWVHNLEHGGVVFVFNCPGAAGCPDVVAELEALEDSLPADPKCTAPGVRTRSLITADALLPASVQVAAAAWGKTYTASCVDAASLRAFYLDHFGRGPEDLCNQGTVP